MKSAIILLALLFSVSVSDSRICLSGRVRFVTYGADYKVRITDAFPDMIVHMVNRTPTRGGEWQQVTYGEDFKVQLVTYGEDFRVQFGNWPRCR